MPEPSRHEDDNDMMDVDYGTGAPEHDDHSSDEDDHDDENGSRKDDDERG